MAGTNKSLKAGTIVFKAGDHADGMYLVRKGELVVYFEQGGKEVVLAKIPEGGMVGEMALFDRMPRSASVKVSVDAEITHISLDDFGKLMKQIPKWFVGLMSALSGRLRTTNERLKSIENGGVLPPAGNAAPFGAKPYQTTLRMLHIMELLWHRDGTKEGKDWMIPRKSVETELSDVFGESPAQVKALLEMLCAENILQSKVDAYRNAVLSMPNRAALRQFASFVDGITKTNPKLRALPPEVLNILTILIRLEAKAPYDQFTVTLEELQEEAAAAKMDSSGWKEHLSSLQGFGDMIKMTKTSSKSELGLRVTKGELTGLSRNLSVFSKLAQKGLDQ